MTVTVIFVENKSTHKLTRHGIHYFVTMLLELLLLALLMLCGSFTAEAFVPSSVGVRLISRNSKSIQTFASKKSEAQEKGYWEGEWICADCGYIYDRDIDGGGLYFEELKKGFICPQCSAPRKRYAKKVGDQWGVTRDGGDLPIYAFTFLGLAVTTWFALVYVPSL